jgi:SAM-dependent methyltransferase
MVVMRLRDGSLAPMPVDRWTAPASADERDWLLALPSPVLDVGCGPGRIVSALAEEGLPALGVDTSPHAIASTEARGGTALWRSIFEPIPGEGRWRAVVVLDGNVGIGGDPHRLLARVRSLLGPGGSALVEVDGPGATRHCEVRIEDDHDVGPWFPWAWLGADRLDTLAAAAGLCFQRWVATGERWVALLTRDEQWLPST